MSKKIQLTIADPCHENWDNMTQAEQGRFCNSCQKQVVDFTNMSDSQLAAFFKKPSTGSTCGRFFHDQLERDIEIPKKRIPWVKYFFQFALPAFLLSMKATAQGTVRMGKPVITVPVKKTNGQRNDTDTLPPKYSLITPAVKLPDLQEDSLPMVTTIRPLDITSCNRSLKGEYTITMGAVGFPIFVIDKKTAVRGRVVNENGKKIPYAQIKIEKEHYPIYGDKKGRFYLPSWVRDSDSVMMCVSRAGYKGKEVTILKKDQSDLIIRLEPIGDDKKNEAPSPKQEEKKSTSLIKQEPLDNSSSYFRLSPNPVQRNNTIHVEFDSDRDEAMHLSVLSLNGSLVLTQSEKIVKGYNQLSVLADSKWSAGVYLIQLANQKGSVVKQERLIVQ